jgi:hypothetical protein
MQTADDPSEMSRVFGGEFLSASFVHCATSAALAASHRSIEE